MVDVVGIYHGYEKPKDANDLLKDFVNDVVELSTTGIKHNGIMYSIRIKAIICDAPAKAFVTYTVCHTGYSSCS